MDTFSQVTIAEQGALRYLDPRSALAQPDSDVSDHRAFFQSVDETADAYVERVLRRTRSWPSPRIELEIAPQLELPEIAGSLRATVAPYPLETDMAVA